MYRPYIKLIYMSIVNFNIPGTLDKRVANVMKQKGFSSKAEFFRFAAIFFMDVLNKPISSEDQRFAYLAENLKLEIAQAYHGKKIPSLKEQLSGI